MFNWNWYFVLEHISSAAILIDAKNYSITSTVVDYDFIPKEGKKEFLWDWSGKKYIDFTSGVGCNNLGYSHVNIKEAVSRQLYKHGIINFSDNDWYNPWATLLKKTLCEITPGKFPKKVFLSNSGTEAVEAAIKMCMKRRPQRKKYLAFGGAFHGRTLGALSLNASKEIHTKNFKRAFDVLWLPFPEKNSAMASLDWKNFFRHHGIDLTEFNAIFLELIQGEGGINVIDKKSLTELKKILEERGVYIAVDEVQTGMMRTGKMFACEHYGLEPDIICLGKGLASGMPIGATVAKAELDFPEPGCHSNTFGGNALTAVAALETIKIFLSWASREYNEMKEKIEIMNGFSDGGLGMMQRIVCKDKKERSEVINRAFNQGLILLGAGEKNIRLMPPLIISKESLEESRRILKSCC